MGGGDVESTERYRIAESKVRIRPEQFDEMLALAGGERVEHAIVLEDATGVGADQRVEPQPVANDDVVADTAGEDVVATAADEPVADVITDDLVGEPAALDALDVHPELAERRARRHVDVLEVQVRDLVERHRQLAERREIVAPFAEVLVHVQRLVLATRSTVEDVVAVSAEVLIRAGSGKHLVVASLTKVGIETLAAEDDVVSFAAIDQVGLEAAVHVVVARATLHLVKIGLTVEPVVASGTDQHVGVVAAVEDVVALTAVHEVRHRAAIHDVVAAFTVRVIRAGTAVDEVIAIAAPNRVVTVAGQQIVAEVGAGDHLVGVVALGVGAVGIHTDTRTNVIDVLFFANRGDRAVGMLRRTAAGGDADLVLLHQIAVLVVAGLPAGCRIRVFAEFNAVVGQEHDVADKVPGSSRPRNHVRELLRAHRVVEIGEVDEAELQRPEIVEAVAVDQPRHLIAEDRVERRSEFTEKDVGLGQTADPGVDLVERLVALIACPHELEGLGCGVGRSPAENADCRLLLGREVGIGHAIAQTDDRGTKRHVTVEGIGGDEVRQRFGMRHVLPEISPADVGLESGVDRDRSIDRLGERRVGEAMGQHVIGLLLLEQGQLGRHSARELFPQLVERRHAKVSAAGDIDRRQILRLAEQLLLQGRGYKFVDLGSDLLGHSLHDGGRADLRKPGGGEEGLFEGVVGHGGGEAAIGVDGIDDLPQHRVAEAERHLAVVERYVGIDARVVHHEERDVGAHEAGILVDRDVLIFPLVHERGSLEHLLLVPGDVALSIDIVALGVGPQLATDTGHRDLPGVGEGLARIGGLRPADVHDQVVDLPLVVFMPHVVHRGQAEVFVDTTVAGDVVVADRTEQDLADDRTAGGVHAESSRPSRAQIEVVAHIPGGRIAAAGRTAHARKAREKVGVAGKAGERICEQVLSVEPRQPVGDEDMIGQLRLDVGSRRVEIKDLAAAIPNPEVGDSVVPGEVGPAGLDDVLPQLIERRQRVLGQRHRAVGIAALPGLIEDGAVEQPHAGGVFAGDRIDHPLAEQVGRRVVRAVGLALVDVWGCVLLILGIGRTDDVVRCAVEAVSTGAGDIIGGAELAVWAGRLRVGNGRPRDRDARHAVCRIVERVAGIKIDEDLACLTVRQVTTLADLVEAVVEELSEQVEDARHRRITGQRVQIADEVFLEVEAVRIRVASLVIPADLGQAGVQIGDLIDEAVGDKRVTADLIGPRHRLPRRDRLGNHPRRAVVDRGEGVGISSGKIHAARHVVAVVSIAEPGERPERRTPAGLIGSCDIVEKALDVADAEWLGRTSRSVSCARPGDDLRQEAGPARLQQVERAELTELDDGLGVWIGVAVDGGAVGLIPDGPDDRHVDLILEEGLIIGGDHEVLDHRGVGDRVEQKRGRDATGRAVIVDDVVADDDFAGMVSARREYVGAVLAIQDRAGRRGRIAHDQARTFGVNKPGEQVARAEDVRDILGARRVTGLRTQEPRAVVAADDMKHRVGFRRGAPIVDLEREDVIDALPLAQRFSGRQRVVENIDERVGGRVEKGRAVDARLHVDAQHGPPAVRGEEGVVVGNLDVHAGPLNRDHSRRHTAGGIIDAAGLDERLGRSGADRERRRRVGRDHELIRRADHRAVTVEDVIEQGRLA